MIELYTAPTPNGHKISCTLKEMGLDYAAKFVNLSKGEQKERLTNCCHRPKCFRGDA